MKDVRKLGVVWKTGRLEWKFDSNQESAWDALQGAWDTNRVHVLNMARQIGKSYFLVGLCDMMARRFPRARIKYAAETGKQVRAIIRPHFAEWLKDCPESLRPVFNTMDGEYRYPNGSTITVGGCETDEDANKLLGQHAHLFVIDEAGSLRNLHYVVKTIAIPQTTNTRGRIIICSTPAKTPDHPFKQYCDEAEVRGTLIERDIYSNPRLSDADLDELMMLQGGEESTEWQREYLVKHVTDADLQIIKFASSRRLKQITLKVDENDPLGYRPQWFDPYAGLDLGWAPDPTGMVWGYLDYKLDTLVIEQEWMMRRMDTGTLASTFETVERELYGDPKNMFQRWGDIEERTINDLQLKHELTVMKTSKDNLKGACNNLNLMVADMSHRIRIHPRCKLLLAQLAHGVWDKEKKKFARSAKHGHYDVLAATVYLARNVCWDKLPDRMVVAATPRNFLEVEDEEVKRSGIVDTIRAAFGME